MKPLTTERLLLREFTYDDLRFVLELHQHPDLVRFIPSAALTDLDGAHDMIERFNSVEGDEYGWWCVTKLDGTPIGAVVLKPIPGSAGRTCTDIEVGWRQHAKYTGRAT